MGEVSLETVAYAKMLLHAAKYPHCAVNGILLADVSKIKDSAKNQDLEIVDAMPLFHHSHYVSPMAEVALMQIEAMVQANNQIIAGYYAACENFRDNTVEKCPGQKIAEKIVEHCPSAIFVVINNKCLMQNMVDPGIKVHKYSDGKWKLKDENQISFESANVLKVVSHLLQGGVQRDLIDFDNYLDNLSQDWTNAGINKLIHSLVDADI